MSASKVVVGIIVSEKDEVTELRKWFSDTTDLRRDQEINEQILEFLEQHHGTTMRPGTHIC